MGNLTRTRFGAVILFEDCGHGNEEGLILANHDLVNAPHRCSESCSPASPRCPLYQKWDSGSQCRHKKSRWNMGSPCFSLTVETCPCNLFIKWSQCQGMLIHETNLNC